MKTTMQELIDELQQLEDTAISISDKFLIKSIKYKAISKLEKEKEQMIEAYEEGKQNGIDSITNIHMYIIGEKYYNQTYNQNK
jgi:hypothetical protein